MNRPGIPWEHEASRAIERVGYSYQIGADEPFDAAVPRQVLEQRVRTYLEQSAALESIWNTPVTGEMLRTELERIARSTWFPDRLQELYDALGDRPRRILLCGFPATLAEAIL
jgi:hypothetical protein